MEVQKRQTQTKEILKTALIKLLQEKDKVFNRTNGKNGFD